MANAKGTEVVVITGASAGLGRAIARRWARPGVAIGLIARDMERLEDTAREVEARGARALPISLDLADADAVEGAAQRIEDELGAIDVWVNNAMLSVFSPIKEMTPDDFRRVTHVTYLGYVYGTLAALKRMQTRNHGVIVQVSSALAYRAIPLQSAYCAAKHAIKGFNESLRCELLHDKSAVKTVMVHMPALNTTQFTWVKSRLARKAQPVPPVFAPEVGANAVHWAAHHPRRDYIVGGPTWQAIVGNKIIPGLLDRYLAHKAYEGQQTSEPEDPQRPNNLYKPAKTALRATGPFRAQARTHSLQWWLTSRRLPLAAGLIAAGAGLLALTSRHTPGLLPK